MRIMYTMYTRGSVLGVLAVLSVLAAGCGGDDSGAAANAAAATCDPMVQTGMQQGPCPQNEPQCPSTMYTAVTTCMPNGRWNTSCSCVLTSSLQGPQAGAGGAATCGNGRVDPGEQCDPAAAMTATCAQMMPGSTGTITCNAAGTAAPCTLKMMCMNPMPQQPMGGQGG